jgi:hypothetical protein
MFEAFSLYRSTLAAGFLLSGILMPRCSKAKVYKRVRISQQRFAVFGDSSFVRTFAKINPAMSAVVICLKKLTLIGGTCSLQGRLMPF